MEEEKGCEAESTGGEGSPRVRRDIYIGRSVFLRSAGIINIHNPELETSVERAARRPHVASRTVRRGNDEKKGRGIKKRKKKY